MKFTEILNMKMPNPLSPPPKRHINVFYGVNRFMSGHLTLCRDTYIIFNGWDREGLLSTLAFKLNFTGNSNKAIVKITSFNMLVDNLFTQYIGGVEK